jgi:biopolymer transport protein TolQ
MNVTQDMSVWGLVSHASLFVQLVMLGLLLASLLSWWYIFRKAFALRQAKADTEAFEKDFWSGGDLNGLYQSAAAAKHRGGSLERIFEAGFREFSKVKRPPGTDRSAAIDGTRRAMSATYQREMDALEDHLAFLASVGSVAPYIGLLGTVIGLINAFAAVAADVVADTGHNDRRTRVAAHGIKRDHGGDWHGGRRLRRAFQERDL